MLKLTVDDLCVPCSQCRDVLPPQQTPRLAPQYGQSAVRYSDADMNCHVCHGDGYIATDAGIAVLQFLGRMVRQRPF